MNPLPASRDSATVIAYVRTSSAEQGKAFGPASQRAAITAFAEREGLTIAAEFHDDISGTTTLEDRPGLSAALAAVYQHGAGALLVAERTRLARKERVAHEAVDTFEAAGARVLYADGSNGDDDSALLLDGIGHVIAAHDRRRIVARLKAGRDAKAAEYPNARAQGGRVSYGYRRTASGLVIEPEAAAHVRRIFELVTAGQSLRKIASELEAQTGRPWRASTIDGIARRRDYTRQQPGRIIDGRVFSKAQDALAARRRSGRPAAR
jgi:DNA invertase Pin-like site-specific DNA recombinase